MSSTAQSAKTQKASLFTRLFGNPQLQVEKDRLEAFLAAFPGEYCGFNPDGSLAFSQGFLSLLGIAKLSSITDIQHALRPGDSAALETCFIRLRENRQHFVLKVQTVDNTKILRLTGAGGAALNGTDRYDIMWVEDVTIQEHEIEEKRAVQQSLELEIKKFKAVFTAFNFPVWLHNAAGDVIWGNTAYTRILKLPLEKVMDDKKELPFTTPKTIRDNLRGGRGRDLKLMVVEAIRGGQPQHENKYLIVAGDRRLMRVAVLPLPHLDLAVGLAQDITREEELEKYTERNTSSSRELMEQLRTAIAIFCVDQKLEFYNSAFAQLWRLEDQWLNTNPKLGDILEHLRDTRRLPEQADFRRYKQTWLDLFTSHIGPQDDMMYLPDGTVLRSLVIPNPVGGLLMTFEDVTSSLELESSYNTLMAVQKETLDNLTEGVAVYGSHGRLKLWNPAYASIWDLNPEDLNGDVHISQVLDKCRKFFPEEDWTATRERMISQLFVRVDRAGEIRRTDGHILHYTSVALPDGGTLVTFQDVTDTVRVEEVLREKTTALEAAERLKLDFLANVSYQLRTPLNAIVGFNEILDKEYFGPLNERQKEYTKGLGEASERLMSLINDILDLSTIEAGYMTLDKTEVNIRAMLTGLYDLTLEWARGQKIEVHINCPENIGTGIMDERRVKQGLLNLVRNAIAYTPAGGCITLAAERIGKDIALSVIDNGPGISPEDQTRIFKPFERTATQKNGGAGEQQGGAGLGLSLVKNIVDLHGGKISLKSALGEGTSMTILLPSDADLN